MVEKGERGLVNQVPQAYGRNTIMVEEAPESLWGDTEAYTRDSQAIEGNALATV